MKRIVLFIIPLFLVACLPVAPVNNATESATCKATAPMPTDFSATKLYPLIAEALTATANSPQNNATITAILADKYAFGTAMAGIMTAMPTLTLTPPFRLNHPPAGRRTCRRVFWVRWGRPSPSSLV